MINEMSAQIAESGGRSSHISYVFDLNLALVFIEVDQTAGKNNLTFIVCQVSET